MSVSRLVARRQLYDDMAEEGLGFSFTAVTGYAATTITTADPRFMFGGAAASAERYRGGYIYRRLRAVGEQIRMANSLTNTSSLATLTHFGPDWSTLTDTDAEMVAMDPDELHRIFEDALDELMAPCPVLLAHGPADWDMQASTTGEWDAGLTNATFAAQTTSSEVFRGARSKVLTLTGAAGYTEADSLVRFGQGQQGSAYAIVKADIGTGIFRILDQGGNTVESVSFTQEQWLLIKKHFTLGADDEGARIRILGTDNLDAIDVQMAGVVRRNEPFFYMPSWYTDKMNLKGVSRIASAVAGRETDTSLAGSIQWESLSEGTDYQKVSAQADANPFGVQILNTALMNEPLFLMIECPYSAPYGVAAPFTAETDETDCPLDLLLAQVKILLGGRYPKKYPTLKAIGAAEKVAALKEQTVPLPPRRSGFGRAFRA